MSDDSVEIFKCFCHSDRRIIGIVYHESNHVLFCTGSNFDLIKQYIIQKLQSSVIFSLFKSKRPGNQGKRRYQEEHGLNYYPITYFWLA